MTVVDSAIRDMSFTVPQDIADTVRAQIARTAWQWYREHSDEVILSRRVLFVKVEIRVRDLRLLFVRLFGSQPAA